MKSSIIITRRLLKQLLLLFALLVPKFASAYDFMVDGLCYNKNSDGTSVTVTYMYNPGTSYPNLIELTIPSSVTYEGNTYSVTKIGRKAFYRCGAMTSVEIPNSVTSIGVDAFYECSGLTSLIIPNSVVSISSDAFFHCRGITSLTIGSSLESINNAFNFDSDLASITVTGTGGKYDSRDNCNAIIETATNTLVFGCKNTVIPNTVIEIGDNAFYSCWRLTSLDIPNSVTKIGDAAFYYCTGLTSIDLNSVTSIGNSAFYNCTALTSITNSNSLSEIGDHAFQNCYGLTSLELPNTLISIGASAFCNCSSLTSMELPNSVTSIGGGAFSGCTNMTSFTMGNKVSEIGQYAFYNCSGLTTMIIPSTVTSIGTSAFSGCSGLRTIHSQIHNPQSVEYGNQPFQGVLTNHCKLFVPQGTVESYQFTIPWSDFLNIIEEGGGTATPIKGDVDGDGIVTSADIMVIYNILLGQDEE